MRDIMPAPRGLVQRFDEHLHRSGLLRTGSRLLVACSGGADSVALLTLLAAVNGGRHWGFSLVAGHVNHRTRGRASDGDAAFVKKLAAGMGVPYMSRVLRRAGGGAAGVRPSEATLREGRFAALVAMARAARCDAIVLAHHADDQAETVLMRMLRGTAFLGLGGIAASRIIGVRFVRPLLPFSRDELRAYLVETGQRWREDASNASPDVLRNRVRHELLPLMTALAPRVRESLVRLAAHAQDMQDVIENIVESVADRAALTYTPRRLPARAVLRRDVLRLEPAIVVGELFRQLISRLGGSLNAVTAERLAAAVRVAVARPGGKAVEMGGGVTMKVVGKSVVFTRLRTRAR